MPAGKATSAKKAGGQPVSGTGAIAASRVGNTGPDPEPGSAPAHPTLSWGAGT